MAGRAALIAALALAGCQNDNICAAPDPFVPETPQNPLQWQRAAESCVHRWAYRLAGADGTFQQVGAAVLGGCQVVIRNYAASENHEAAPEPYFRRLQGLAEFHVAQARAGNCTPP